MDERFKKIARIGYVSKGTVYALTGILAFGAAIGLGGRSEGKLGVLKFLQEQPFGNVLLGVLGIGLLCYAFWRFLQSIQDPEDIGTSGKAIGKRVGFFFSGMVYLALGGYAIYQVFSPVNGSNSEGKSLLPTAYLDYIFYAVAIGMAIKAIFQWRKVYKGDFLKKFHLNSLSNVNTRRSIKWLGYAGLVSRGIIVAIVAYFFFRAASSAGSQEIKGTREAFSFLRQNSEGPWLVGLVALGLICYGIYMFTKARYRRFDD